MRLNEIQALFYYITIVTIVYWIIKLSILIRKDEKHESE